MGLRYPPVTGAGWGWIAGADAVDQAVRTILLTEPGERLARPQFGAGLRRWLFAPNSIETRASMRRAVEDALLRDEGRVRLHSVDVSHDEREPTLLRIVISYEVPADPGPRTLVHPFYLQGGAG